MNSLRPASSLLVLWLTTRLALRRQLNVWQSIRLGRKKNASPQSPQEPVKRTGTATKSRGRSVFSVFLLVIMGFNGFNIASQGLTRLAQISQNLNPGDERIVVSRYTELQLASAEVALKRANEFSEWTPQEKYIEGWNRYVDQLLQAEVRNEGLSEEDEQKKLAEMHGVFAERGAAGFKHRGAETLWVSSETWPREEEAKGLFLGTLTVISCLWLTMMIILPLGLNNRNLGQVEWSFEWMFTFPASARALFCSKIFGYSTLNPLVWLFFLPFLILVYVAGGAGWHALPLGIVAMLYFSILGGAATTLSEVAARKFLSLAKVKNVQAVCTILGTIAVLLCYASALSEPLGKFLVHSGERVTAALLWNPISLPLILGLPGATALQKELSAGGMAIFAMAAVVAALGGSEWMTRDGLVIAGGPYQGQRSATRAGHASPSWLRGIAANEMLLLARDRNLFVQVLIVPLLLPAYFLLINPKMISAVTGNFRHAAAMVFGVGAYSFLSTAMQMLNREDKTLWYLLSLPQPLDSILRKKAMVWAIIGMMYGAGLLLVLVVYSRHLLGSAIGNLALAIYGIALYAYIASGIGILATDVLETEKRARIRTDMVYLYMILAAMYANTIYSASVWSKLAQLVLSTLLAYALWQKVKDLCPYILDPIDQPPPAISLADGMIAALAFFVMQGLLAIFIRAASSATIAQQITMAYGFAGLIVGSLTLLIFWRRKIPDLWRVVGLVRNGGGKAGASPWMDAVYGIGAGTVAALGAIVYVRILTWFPQWETWKQNAEFHSFFTKAGNPMWLIGLAVLAAPVFEEFLFRGLILQGLKRTAGPAVAVLGSAALFALIHPPISVVPVFGLGIAAALSFQKTGWLVTPILAHAVYNACVVFFNKI